jgi:hypothetical protein
MMMRRLEAHGEISLSAKQLLCAFRNTRRMASQTKCWLSRRLGNQRSEIDISLSESKAGHSVYFIILDSLGSL